MIRIPQLSNSIRRLPLSVVILGAFGCSESPVLNSKAEMAPLPAQPVSATTNPAVDLTRPSPQPDRIVLTWTGDPFRSQAVTWRTDATVTVALAELAVAEDNAQFARRARQIKASTTDLKTDVCAVRYHTAEFEALSPSTTYAYRVGDGKNWSEWFHFITASDRNEPFSFLYFGDAQNDLKSMWSRVVRQAFLQAPKIRFILHAGDLVNNCQRDAEWSEWFYAGGWINGMIPCVPTPGNHEYLSTGSPPRSTLSDRWRPQFALPENGPAELLETVYWIDYQGTRLVSLNSNEKLAEQAVWLDRLLLDNPCRWTIVTFHHPVYSPARSRDNSKLRAAWQPIFDKHAVDLVLQGHDHSYARTGMVSAGSTETSQIGESVPSQGGRRIRGTVYVVSVSGPKMYDVEKPVPSRFQRVGEDVQLFQVITIDGNELRYESRTATGTPYDGFTLRKREGQASELIEQVPSTPPRLRLPPKTLTIDPPQSGHEKKNAG